MGNKQGNLREQNHRGDASGQPPIPIRTAPGHQPYNAPAGADPMQAEMMQMVSTPNSAYMDFGYLFFGDFSVISVIWLFWKMISLIHFSPIWTILAGTNVVHISGIGL